MGAQVDQLVPRGAVARGEATKMTRMQTRGQVRNDDQIDEFKIKEGESWRNDFYGKCVDFCPSWKGMKKVRMCPGWHSKGDCFDDRNNKANHVTSKEVSDCGKTEYRKYLKKIRSE